MIEINWTDRFWSKVCPDPNSGCWLWTGNVSRYGYGLFKIDGQNRSAHRVAFERVFGLIPRGPGYHGVCVLHRCDTRCCVNPTHLYLGTQRENVLDCAAKGRRADFSGARSPHARLTLEKVREIRARKAQGESYRTLAAAYGVVAGTISFIVKGQTWREPA